MALNLARSYDGQSANNDEDRTGGVFEVLCVTAATGLKTGSVCNKEDVKQCPFQVTIKPSKNDNNTISLVCRGQDLENYQKWNEDLKKDLDFICPDDKLKFGQSLARSGYHDITRIDGVNEALDTLDKIEHKYVHVPLNNIVRTTEKFNEKFETANGNENQEGGDPKKDIMKNDHDFIKDYSHELPLHPTETSKNSEVYRNYTHFLLGNCSTDTSMGGKLTNNALTNNHVVNNVAKGSRYLCWINIIIGFITMIMAGPKSNLESMIKRITKWLKFLIPTLIMEFGLKSPIASTLFLLLCLCHFSYEGIQKKPLKQAVYGDPEFGKQPVRNGLSRASSGINTASFFIVVLNVLFSLVSSAESAYMHRTLGNWKLMVPLDMLSQKEYDGLVKTDENDDESPKTEKKGETTSETEKTSSKTEVIKHEYLHEIREEIYQGESYCGDDSELLSKRNDSAAILSVNEIHKFLRNRLEAIRKHKRKLLKYKPYAQRDNKNKKV